MISNYNAKLFPFALLDLQYARLSRKDIRTVRTCTGELEIDNAILFT